MHFIPRPLNVRQLEAFRAVMLTGSMTGGGRLLSISQPAVTRLIRDLEAELKLTLFLREGTQIIPTREGKELYREVERHFVSTERIREAADAIREFNGGQLRIASILALSTACIPKTVERFLRDYPGMALSIHSGQSLDIIDLVVNGSVDIGFVAIPPGRNDLIHEDVPASEAVCLVPRQHPLAAKHVIGPADLDGQDFIALGQSSLMRLELNALLQLANSHPRVRVESLFSSTVASYVNSGLGLGIVDPLAAALADKSRVIVRRFAPTIQYSLSIVYPRRTEKSLALRDFVAVFLRAFEEEIADTEKLITATRRLA
ncbi:LysR substrate-binding domain-containing protein [Chelatococcus asaccharovorans]|nr:LysR substrate-binding domain-containing protein [Chelatococcus asaccharovorans]MBS7707555.1 LysR family transcriptional regulator [Chelatococcus asaccharovorans]CAH1658794.1 DNA-binding transcriptional LysR family regulator [Chelatococcus asaccharovorans]CAH1688386.1 DNA-binding transcriptional LysR family regulator [Chelatococcus asaccharovorans]